MRTYQVTQREGERMGDVDYTFNFRSHYDAVCTSEQVRDEMCKQDVGLLKDIETRFKSGESLDVRMGDYWHRLLDVGMYDGWPYWRQTPAVFIHNTLGGEWHFWYDIDGFRGSK